MSTVKIIVINDSAVRENFSIFNDLPQNPATVGQTWQNVWAVSPQVDSTGGSTTFGITEQYYAVCGMSPQPLAGGVTVSTQDQVNVTLDSPPASSGSLVPMVAAGGGVSFDKDQITQESDEPGSYEINTLAWDAEEYKFAFLGLGRDNPTPNAPVAVTPVAVIQADPSSRYYLFPSQVYYISTGQLIEGMVVKITQLGQIATIDFTGKSENVATVHLQDDLTYSTPVYSFDTLDDEK